jgi:predicted acetyltransferase
VPIDVRSIAADELEAWVETMHVAFHSRRSAADEAEFRRDVRHQDLERTIAAFDGARMIGTYETFTAQLSLPGGECAPADAVTSVGVLPSHHRRGVLTRMITQDLHAARERGEVASILIAAEYPIYGRFGFGPATEEAAYRLKLDATRFTRAPAGSVDLVAPAQLRELAPRLFDAFRRDCPGQIDRRPYSWDTRLGLRRAPWRDADLVVGCAVYASPAGEPQGYVVYTVDGDWHQRVPQGKLEVDELVALSGDAYLALWRFCAEVDLLAEVSAGLRPLDEPLPRLLDNARAAFQQTLRSDFLWLRPLDIPRFLSGRHYATEQRLVVDVTDPIDLCNGRYLLDVGPTGATVKATTLSADLSLSVAALAALSLGGANARALATAGLIQAQPATLRSIERMFHWDRVPWCSTFF